MLKIPLLLLMAGGMTSTALGGAATAKSKPSIATLPIPPLEDSLELVEFNPRAMASWGDHMVFATGKNKTFVRLTWVPSGKTRSERFGALLDQKRLAIDHGLPEAMWRGLWVYRDVLAVLDGAELNLLALGAADHELKSKRTMPWDGIALPPRDRGGEAPRPEVVKLRQRFGSEFRHTMPLRIAGVAELDPPAEGSDQKASGVLRLLALTRLPSFPLVQLSCQRQEPSNCAVERVCSVTGLKIDPAARIGFGYSQESKLIVVGDSSHQRLLVGRFTGCGGASIFKQLALPERFKKLSMIHVDGSERLWIGTEVADDFANSSVFTWRSDVWKALLK